MELAQWVAKRIPYGDVTYTEKCRSIGFMKEGRLWGAVVFHNYVPALKTIEISFATEGTAHITRSAIKQVLAYPFEHLGCNRITSLVVKSNKAGRRFNERIGFKLEGKLRKSFNGEDCFVYGLLYNDYKNSPYFAE